MNSWLPRAIVTLLWMMSTAGAIHAAAQDAAPRVDREMTQLRGDLYRVRDDRHHTLFLVTPTGIILADPLSRPLAMWLADELERRFPGRPVRFVLHSHHDYARSEGASVFNDTAELIGHRSFNGEVSAARRVAPDRYRFVRNVESTYDSRRTIMLDSAAVELIHVRSDAPEMTALHFVQERVVFVVEPPPVTSVPFAFGRLRPQDVMAWMGTISTLDFETLVFGDGQTVSRAELIGLAEYLRELVDGVAAGYEQGATVDAILMSSLLQSSAGTPHFAGRDAQIRGVYRTMRLIRGTVSVSGFATYGPSNSAHCAAYTSCYTGGVVPGGSAGAALLIGRKLGIVTEFSVGAQSWSSRTSQFYDDEVALRQSRGAILLLYSPPSPGPFAFAVLGGVSLTIGRSHGMDRVKGALLPVGGRHPIVSRVTRMGWTLGVEGSRHLGGGLSLVTPIRITAIRGNLPTHWPHGFDVQAGVGMTMRVLRRVH